MKDFFLTDEDNIIDSLLPFIDNDIIMKEKFNFKKGIDIMRSNLLDSEWRLQDTVDITQEDIKLAIDYLLDNKNKISKRTLNQLIALLVTKLMELKIDKKVGEKINKAFLKNNQEYSYY